MLEDRRFVEANPGCDPGLECFYVGMTGLTPEERYARHKSGKQSSRIAKTFHRRLRMDLFEGLNPMTYDEAKKMEPTLAEELRAKGHAVWQH